MSVPRWITKEGNLGIIPEAEYYELPLSAFDSAGGLLYFSLVSGDLPSGLQIVSPLDYTMTVSANVTVLRYSYITQESSGANAQVFTEETFNNNTISFRYINKIPFDLAGDIKINDDNFGIIPLSISPPAQARIQGIPVFDRIEDKTVESTFTIRTTNLFTDELADRTFSLSITNIAPPIITTKSKNRIVLTQGQPLTLSPGDYVSQDSSGANARVMSPVTLSNGFMVQYIDQNRFFLNSGKLRVNEIQVDAVPVSVQPAPFNWGLYFDGSEIVVQFAALEFSPGSKLTWRVATGNVPEGLTFSSSGLLEGYVRPMFDPNPLTDDGWDQSPWNLFGWDFPPFAIAKTFAFETEVFDGLNYDQSLNIITIFPRTSVKADNDIIKVDTTIIEELNKFTVDFGPKHKPIITTKQDDIPLFRQDTFLSINFEAVDLDNDILTWAVPVVASGAFDEQVIIGNSVPYIANTSIGGFLYEGIAPRSYATSVDVGGVVLSTNNFTGIIEIDRPHNLSINDLVYFSGVSAAGISTGLIYYVMSIPGASSVIVTSVFGGSIPIALDTSSDLNLRIASLADPQVTVVDEGGVNLTPNDEIKVLNSDNIWIDAVVTSSTIVELQSNVLPYLTTGNTISQPSTGANGTIISIDPKKTGKIKFSGNIYTGTVNTLLQTHTIYLSSNLSVSVGDIITQQGSNANAVVTDSSINSDQISVLYNVQYFNFNNGNILINGTPTSIRPTLGVKDIRNITLTVNEGDIITQTGTSANAIAINSGSDIVNIEVRFFDTGFNPNAGGNIRINGFDMGVKPVGITTIEDPFHVTVQPGQYITQPSTGANAKALNGFARGTIVDVEYISGTFIEGLGNLKIGSSNVNAYPGQVTYNQNVTVNYGDSRLWTTESSQNNVIIDGVPTNVLLNRIVAVGLSLGFISTEGTFGFDETKFDQGQLALPVGLDIDPQTGWLTGQLPVLTTSEVTYTFEVLVYKSNDPNYRDSQIYSITVLGDLNNRIEWITSENLGSIINGSVSRLRVEALHAFPNNPKSLIYELTRGQVIQLPPGLQLMSNGYLIGRVGFDIFSIDQGTVTIDRDQTTFDNTYSFTVTAKDYENTVRSTKTFVIRVIPFNKKPFENLYLKALPTLEQRRKIVEILSDQSIFDNSLIYRPEDPYFGVAKSLKSLFLHGLNPSSAAEYTLAADNNHFRKRIILGNIKTARAIDENLNVIYEVVYLEVKDENTNVFGKGPQNTINLQGIIDNPYYDKQSNQYFIAEPNAFTNMSSAMISEIGYYRKGALPEWMTSRQEDQRVLGFTRAVVLAYTKPGASKLIAYKLKEYNFNFNEIDFTIDRYQLDNELSKYYNTETQSFLRSTETTFDRYPKLSLLYTRVATIDYAVSNAFELIHNKFKTQIQNSIGGLDGIRNFKHGDTLVFFEQEFFFDQMDIGDYNQGWNRAESFWGGEPYGEAWDYDSGTPGTESPASDDDIQWDQTGYVPGFIENNLDPGTLNQRIGIWQVNILSGGLVRLTFVRTMKYFETLYVRNGRTYGGTNIFYNPIIKEERSVPNYSIIPQEININYTTFDGNGTRFFNFRTEFILPEQNDKYIKFTKTGVFT